MSDAIEAAARAMVSPLVGWDGLFLREQGEYLRLARAAIAAYLSAQWQPIETAPKDERYVWLGNTQNIRIGWWANGEQFEHSGSVDGGWRDMHLQRDLGFIPSHWQPLPEPPKEAK